MPKFLNDSGLSHLIDKIKSLFKKTHQEIGINIWDEEWCVGMYDLNNGKFVTNSLQRVASMHFIPIIPSEKYWATYTVIGINLYFYDKRKAFISAMTNLSSSQFPITAPSNAYYMTFDLHDSYGTTYKNDTCINVSDADINGIYYPYRGLRKQITEVSNEALDIKMLGWSVPTHMGVKNTITPYGLFQQNVGRIKIKTHTWNTTAAGIFYASLTERSFGSGNFNVTSNNYPTHTNSHSSASTIVSLVAQYGDGIYINAGSNTIFIADSRYSTNTQFLAAVGNEYLYCELATKPAAINIDGNEATLPQGVDDTSGINLTSSYGTISDVHMVRVGKLVNIAFIFLATTEVPQNTNFIDGLPTPIVTFMGINAINYTAAQADMRINVYQTFLRTDRNVTIANSHRIYVNATYIAA